MDKRCDNRVDGLKPPSLLSRQTSFEKTGVTGIVRPAKSCPGYEKY